jgi:hypothetical protein
MAEPTMEYYTTIFRHSPQNLTVMRQLLLNDFEAFESVVREAFSNRDEQRLRAELHRMRPIISNLRFNRMTALLDKFHEVQGSSSEFQEWQQQLISCVHEIYSCLRADQSHAP